MSNLEVVIAGIASTNVLTWNDRKNGLTRTVERERGASLLTKLVAFGANVKGVEKPASSISLSETVPRSQKYQEADIRASVQLSFVEKEKPKDSEDANESPKYEQYKVEEVQRILNERFWPDMEPDQTTGPGQERFVVVHKPETDEKDKVLVMDDTDIEFIKANCSAVMSSPRIRGPEFDQYGKVAWFLYQMNRPIGMAQQWTTLFNGSNKTPNPQHVVLILNADHLRAEEGISISRRISWERTVEDFVKDIKLLEISQGDHHLIVRFSCDGAIHYHCKSKKARLFYDPQRIEDGFFQSCPGKMIGISSAFTAGLAIALTRAPPKDEREEEDAHIDKIIAAGIRLGLCAARTLLKQGFHSPVDSRKAPDYPVEELKELFEPKPFPETIDPRPGFKSITEEDRLFESVIVPERENTSQSAEDVDWTILNIKLDRESDDIQKEALKKASEVVIKGPMEALAKMPIAQFQDLITADRKEMESFRSISRLLQEYWGGKQTKPLSIAVFGPPGAGKSFTVKQIALEAAKKIKARDKKFTTEWMSFNLSQFRGLNDLNVAFNLIRDQNLNGKMPVVLFDEFDTSFQDTALGWLRCFLAPMQDGEFLENGEMHPIGSAIFFFAGGTSKSFKDFSKYVGATPDMLKERAEMQSEDYLNSRMNNAESRSNSTTANDIQDARSLQGVSYGSQNAVLQTTRDDPSLPNASDGPESDLANGIIGLGGLALAAYFAYQAHSNEGANNQGPNPQKELLMRPLLRDEEEAFKAFQGAKGPDFTSRLRGYVDILGPGQVDSGDIMFPIRRAILLHSLLKAREPRLKSSRGIAIDRSVLHAFLSIPSFRHGARSIEAILGMSIVTGNTQFERSALPTAAQLEMHVDSKKFLKLMKDYRSYSGS